VKLQLERLIAAGIVALGLALALVWAFRVPLFQSPDENAHADYAFALFSTHAPIRARDATPATDVHPAVRYLEDHSGFRTMRYNPDGRVPAGYGTREYFRALASDAPRVPATFLAQNGGHVPWVARYYAYLYYALDALAIGAGALVSGGSVVAEFFAARLFNVVLLGITLVLTWLTLVELRLNAHFRLALLAAIAWFPLTSWVSAYVQPDNLAFTAVALVFYLSLRLRRAPDVIRAALWLGLALGLLALTKPQYFIPVALPALLDRTLRSVPRLRTLGGWVAYLAFAAGPAVLCALSALWVSAGLGHQVGVIVAANANPLGVMWSHGFPAFAGYVIGQIADAWRTTFYYGLPFVSYWGMISWTGYRFEFGSGPLTDLVFTLIGLFSQVVAVLVAVRLVLVWRRLANVARRSSRFAAAKLLASDVILNGYLLFGVAIFAVLISTGGALGQQGRYWLPLILPAMLCATRYAPQVFRRAPERRVFALGMSLGLVIYSIAGSYAGLAALEGRFYRPSLARTYWEYQARITRIGPYNLYEPQDEPFHLKPHAFYPLDGWAIDSRTGKPALAVFVAVDRRLFRRTRNGLSRPDVVLRLHDDTLVDSGFATVLDTAALSPGEHQIGLEVLERDQRAHLSRALVRVIVEDR
jgi:hypothetical protein